ncbi:MAG: hypothetical protein JW945_05350 [Methanomicrobia archaeon]|nr:hypothetical protein [Methanomicrobia archaeon]
MIPLSTTEMLVLHGTTGTVAIVKVGTHSQFLVETPDREIVLGLNADDVLVASGFGIDEKIANGLRCVLYMIREVNSPLIVLPKNHPATKRLRIVVAAGKRVVLSCKITPGTHPEQQLLCGMPEFEGLEILGIENGVELRGIPHEASYETKSFL